MAGYKVIVDHPEAGDTNLYIHGLGTFHNGTTTEVSLDQVRLFRAAHSVVETETDEEGRMTHKPMRGPSPADLAPYGVRFEKIDADSDTSTGEEDN
jgi:hypothetical protein